MIIGIPKEIKEHEYRVSLLPSGVGEFTRAGHKVIVQKNAGLGAGFADEEYARTGAEILDTPAEVFGRAEMIMKVKEPQPSEMPMMRENQLMFTYFHFASERKLTEGVRDSGSIAIAYETLQEPDGSLPLLTPMSEIAGRMAVQIGARFLEKSQGGRGVLLSGVPGVPPANVMILGAGIVGTNAARIAAGMGAQVFLYDNNIRRMRHLDDITHPNITTVYCTHDSIIEKLPQVDLVIGAVLLPGAKTPNLIRREDLKLINPGAVMIDVAIDQGGCIETARPTSHSNPIFIEEGVVHYCVSNMPGAVPRTSAFALCNATLPWALRLAELGLERTIEKFPFFASAVNIYRGEIVNLPVAETFQMEFSDRFSTPE